MKAPHFICVQSYDIFFGLQTFSCFLYKKSAIFSLLAPVLRQAARSISKIFFIIPEQNLTFCLIFFPIL